MDEFLILACANCGARFKIRHPQPGAEFSCNRCKNIVQIPGKMDGQRAQGQKPNVPDIVKIELPQSQSPTSMRKSPSLVPSTGLNSTTQRFISQPLDEDALQIKDRQSASLQKRIFATSVENRQRLLYLISKYTKLAEKGKKGIWIRKLPLQVFMFEGVVHEIFDWDYAPASVFHAEGRSFVNISQEGEEDLLSLLSAGYVHNLKLTTTQHRNITAYQISPKGAEFLSKIPEEDQKAVNDLICCPQCASLLAVKKKGDQIYLYCPKKECGHERRSTITDAEDVSYFCIPYFVPTLTKFSYTPPFDLGKRLHGYFEANPRDNIKDQLEELIYLSDAKVLISEWIPFGSNHMAALNYKLGSHERIQSAKFTQEVDCSPGGTLIQIPESLTLVKVRDYGLADYVDFEAISHLPEDKDIIQVEEFAVHINSRGYVRYGLEILAINERDHDKVSLDHLPRLLVDVLQDSTTIMDTLLTNYQKSLLDLIFQGKAKFRDKYFFVMANDIHCFEVKEDEPISAELMRILSQANYQDELNQVTEEVKETAMFSDGTVLILGSHGSILVTRTPEKYESLVADFLFVMDVELFLNNFFTRLFLMNDELKDIQKLIENCEADPNAMTTVQQMLSRTASDAILMEEVRGYLDEAMTLFQSSVKARYPQFPEDMQEIIQTFRIQDMATVLQIRIQDIQKIIKGTQECLNGLTRVTDVISERQMRRIQEALSNNTRSLEDITKTNERSGMSLRILEIILAGSLAFNIMDQFTGDWTMSDDATLHQWLQPLFDCPGIWLLCSLTLWTVMALSIFLFMRWLENINAKAIAARFKLDLPCNIKALKQYLGTKDVVTHDADIFSISNLIKVCWEETDKSHWLGNRPKVELVYDEKNGFVLSALIEVTRPTRKTSSYALQEIFFNDLHAAGVLRGRWIR